MRSGGRRTGGFYFRSFVSSVSFPVLTSHRCCCCSPAEIRTKMEDGRIPPDPTGEPSSPITFLIGDEVVTFPSGSDRGHEHTQTHTFHRFLGQFSPRNQKIWTESRSFRSILHPCSAAGGDEELGSALNSTPDEAKVGSPPSSASADSPG